MLSVDSICIALLKCSNLTKTNDIKLGFCAIFFLGIKSPFYLSFPVPPITKYALELSEREKRGDCFNLVHAMFSFLLRITLQNFPSFQSTLNLLDLFFLHTLINNKSLIVNGVFL